MRNQPPTLHIRAMEVDGTEATYALCGIDIHDDSETTTSETYPMLCKECREYAIDIDPFFGI